VLSLAKFRWHSCQPVAVALLISAAGNSAWASNPETPKPCTGHGKSESVSLTIRQSMSENGGESGNESIREKEDSPATETLRVEIPAANSAEKKSVASGFCLPYFAHNLVSDQKTIWTSPLHLEALDTGDKNWLVPLGAGALGLIAADRDIMRHFGSIPIAHSSSFSNYGLAAMVGSAATLYLRGATRNDDRSRETGFLGGEAAVNSLLVAETMKLVFQRPRPTAASAGSFGAGGASFPSEHALAAWSMASVIAHEYPGPLTKLLAYGAASGISLARVAGRDHFPSDVVVGGALGYLIGRYVYRAHHNPELPGARANDLEKEVEEETPPRARTPSELASPSVPLDSWVYAAFDRLAALGYAPSAYANLRPESLRPPAMISSSTIWALTMTGARRHTGSARRSPPSSRMSSDAGTVPGLPRSESKAFIRATSRSAARRSTTVITLARPSSTTTAVSMARGRMW